MPASRLFNAALYEDGDGGNDGPDGDLQKRKRDNEDGAQENDGFSDDDDSI